MVHIINHRRELLIFSIKFEKVECEKLQMSKSVTL